MSDASSLSKDQIATIQSWADDGTSLSDIQKRLGDEMDFRVTYMEMRFLIEDLGITLKSDPVPEEKEEEPAEAAVSEEPESEPAADAIEGDEGVGEVIPDETADPAAAEDPGDSTATAKVTISELERPGMMASGRVEFDGGESAEWYVDQMGQLGINPDNKDFKPSEAQARAFQMELQEAAKKKGV